MTYRLRKGIGIAVLLVIWLIVIFNFSSQPFQKQDIKPKLRQWISDDTAQKITPDITFHYHQQVVSGKDNPYGFIEFFIRKFAHMFEYGTFSILMYASLFLVKRSGWRVSLALMSVIVLASIDEWNQSFVANRTPAVQDVGIDLFGGILAISLLFFVKSIRWGKMRKTSLYSE